MCVLDQRKYVTTNDCCYKNRYPVLGWEGVVVIALLFACIWLTVRIARLRDVVGLNSICVQTNARCPDIKYTVTREALWLDGKWNPTWSKQTWQHWHQGLYKPSNGMWSPQEMLSLGIMERQLSFLRRCNETAQFQTVSLLFQFWMLVQVYEILTRGERSIHASWKAAVSPMSMQVIPWLTYMLNVGAFRMLGTNAYTWCCLLGCDNTRICEMWARATGIGTLQRNAMWWCGGSPCHLCGCAQMQVYERLRRADTFTHRSFKLTVSQISVWWVALLAYTPSVGALSMHRECLIQCPHTRWFLGMPWFWGMWVWTRAEGIRTYLTNAISRGATSSHHFCQGSKCMC